MIRHRFFLTLLFLLALPLPLPAAGFDFSDYRTLLDRYLVSDRTIHGIAVNVLDYQRMQQEQDRPGTPYLRLLMDLGKFDPDGIGDPGERTAFWINVYNIAAIKTILDHYPVASIRSRKIHWLRRPWKRKVIKVGERVFSLREIEKKVLSEKEPDLRAYLAMNSATVSSPDLPPAPYRGILLEDQFRAQGERFASQPHKGLRIERGQGNVLVSKIFRFERRRFAAWTGGPVAFLMHYIEDATAREYLESGDYRIGYLEFDWTLNDLKLVDK